MKDEPLFRALKEITRKGQDDRIVVLVGHGFIELMVNALVTAHCKHAKKIAEDNRGYPHSARLVILNERNIIDDDTYKVLDNLRKLRNRSAHDPFFEVTADQINEAAKPFLKRYFKGPQGTEALVTGSLGKLFSSVIHMLSLVHEDVLGPAFSPIYHGELKEQLRKAKSPPTSA